ncbi:hypothetical protein FUA23_19440 [Neolewinella aurantiaca]|uniref:Periplasmic heavy metal sensor n=1 Tax=Neolewinella aurantiaca TaxID=2602767 RepID=A0A5C7FNJ8_9BACT|nr:hypothetical protein [Neolewinella aurantiaca]TXF86295.1 hypothetical protein FUA23_19440 [Neolewinella aurantiaca]
MEKVTLYKFTIAGLLLLNLILVAFLWFGRPSAQFGPGTFEEPFGLNEQQKSEFFESVEKHKAITQQVNMNQREILKNYFGALKDPTVFTSQPVPPEIISLEEQKIQSTYDHFLAVKNILTPEQLSEYPGFIDHVIRQVLKRGQQKPKPGRRNDGERPEKKNDR